MDRENIINAINNINNEIDKQEFKSLSKSIQYINLPFKHPLMRKSDFDQNGNINANVIDDIFKTPSIDNFPSLLLEYQTQKKPNDEKIKNLLDEYVNFIIKTKKWADEIRDGQIIDNERSLYCEN